LYTVALKSGDPEAMLGMAGWHMTGADGILLKNEQRAFQLVKEAADKELPRAQYTLGYFYEGGIGVEKNMDLAFKFYYQAAEQGD
jgi:TPR repeat protein